ETVVIDTPGIREFAPYGIEKQDLAHYFIEFLPYVNNCKFNTCTHFHEPGCAVVQAVEEEEIDIQRYYSYLNLLETIEDDVIY
ncbi:MAG: ribosome small subunit-dependent GTPase A, partial [Melioribacteraceae bacterium]|nr:ribosome small subunit-dependent GTPase A [Melioribacteraceae bacterium]